MRRRTLFKLFGSMIYLPFVKTGPASAQAQAAYDGLIYSDSENTDPALLAALGDLNVMSGGVEYAA